MSILSTLRDKIINEHINRNYPNSRLVNYDDKDSGLVFYDSDELQSVDDDWFPLCCYKDSNTGKAVYGGRQKVFHTYTEGETGAGKTTRFVMQAIFALSNLKIKPSFVIVDIHGEITENLYHHLKKNGYNIKILNCDNPQRSDTYNPFSKLAEECMRTHIINNDAINKIRKISEIIQPVESNQDPIWDKGARSYTNGCILDKFEDLIKGDIPEDCLTIYNVIQNHYWLRDMLSRSSGMSDLFQIPHYNKKGTKALSTQKMISVTNNAEKTKASYFGVVENHYDTFGQPSMYSLSSNNTIDIVDFIDKPTVIVIQSGSTKIGDDLISLLMNDIYTYVVKTGKNSKLKKLPRNIHCFLDEFANCNIADGPEYIKMLTTSRKFGMFWHMILQCDAQLDRKFDPNIGRIIRANSTEIFMGSHDYETEVRFSKSCGQKTIESLESVIAQKDPRLEVVDLMTPERLNLTEEGYVYVKSNRHPLLKTYIEAFYNCDEFVPVDDIDMVYPYNTFDYKQTSFFPDDLPPEISSQEYSLLEYIHCQIFSLQELMDHFTSLDIKNIIRLLALKNLIELLDDHKIKSNLTRRQFDIYRYREKNGFNNDSTVRTAHNVSEYKTSKNPFDFNDDYDDENFNLSYEPNINAINEWLGDDDFKYGPLFEDIKNHLKDFDVFDLLNKIEELTIIPDCLLNAVRYLTLSSEDKKKAQIALPKNNSILKFNIIEKFIYTNEFSTKDEWITNMQNEYDLLVKENAFPHLIMDEFKNALNEVKFEFTLSNIREIKKIISENNNI